MKMTNDKDYGRLTCPDCAHPAHVGHMNWDSLGCMKCGAMIRKTRWLVPLEVVEDVSEDDPEAERERFVSELNARLDAGAHEYGDTSFDRPIASTLDELEDEVVDVAGWAFVLWVQLRRRRDRIEDGLENISRVDESSAP